MDSFRERLEKAVKAKEQCDGGGEYCTISVENDWRIKVYAHPSEQKLHKVIAALTPLTGRLEKQQQSFGTAFEFAGSNDDFDVTVITPEQCKIVGHKVETRKKKVFVEVDEVEVVKTPVTDCDFRAGRVKAGEFVPLEESTNANG